MATRYPKDNALVACNHMGHIDRKDLNVGDEVIISVNYGKHRLRETITNRTPTQVKLSNDSRYSLNSGRKIGTAESYSSPTILGRPTHTREEAERLNAAIAAAAEAAAQKATLADILDQVEKLADDRGVGIGEVLEELNQLNIQRFGDAMREHMEAKNAGQ